VDLLEPFVMLQLVVGDLPEHGFAQRIAAALGVLEVEFSLPRFVAEGNFEGIQAVFLLH